MVMDPSDLASIQEVITKVSATSLDVETTSNLLKENIRTISAHDANTGAHPDIRAKIKTVEDNTPKIISNPEISGPLSVENAESYAFTFTATPRLADTEITKFKLVIPPNNIEQIHTTPEVANNSLTTTLSFTGQRFEQQVLTSTAYDNLGNESDTTSLTLTVTNNAPPDVSAMSCIGLPEYVNPGDTVSFTISGATDIDIPFGDVLAFSVNSTNLIFEKTTGLTDSSTFTFTVPNTVIRGNVESFSIIATDTKNASATKTFSVKINQVPSMANFVHTLPLLIGKGTTTNFQMSGATDADSQPLTYAIFDLSTNISISKVTDISAFEVLQLTVSETANVGDPISFRVVVSDPYGSSDEKTINTSKVNIPPDVTNLICDLPLIVKPNDVHTFKLSGGSDVDGGNVTYTVSCSDLSYTFSKTSGIVDNEEVQLTIPNSALRGSTFTITVGAVDSIGATTNKVFTYSINRLINTTNATFNIPNIIKPNTTYSNLALTDVSDDDTTQVISMNITSTDPTITFSKSTNLSIGELFDIVVGDATRGTAITIQFSLSDGIETITKSYIVTINSLPNIDNLVCNNLPTDTTGSTTPIAVSFTGTTDNNNAQTIIYSISSISTGLVFSKTVGIVDNETINLTISKVADVTIKSFTLTITDGLESVTKVYNITVNPIYIVNTPTVTYPASGAVLTSDAVTFTFDPMNVTIDS